MYTFIHTCRIWEEKDMGFRGFREQKHTGVSVEPAWLFWYNHEGQTGIISLNNAKAGYKDGSYKNRYHDQGTGIQDPS